MVWIKLRIIFGCGLTLLCIQRYELKLLKDSALDHPTISSMALTNVSENSMFDTVTVEAQSDKNKKLHQRSILSQTSSVILNCSIWVQQQ